MSDAERVRDIYNRRASSYEQRNRGAKKMRSRLFGYAHGEVLELGVGTGATFVRRNGGNHCHSIN